MVEYGIVSPEVNIVEPLPYWATLNLNQNIISF